MSLADEIQIGILILIGLPLVFAFVGSYFEMKAVAKQVQPNGGQSMHDRILHLEISDKDKVSRLDRIEKKTDEQTKMLIEIGASNVRSRKWEDNHGKN